MTTGPNNNSPLFQPFVYKCGVHLKNRVAMAPMTTWSSNDDSTISDEEVRYYLPRVQGVDLVITGCSRVSPSGQGFTDEFASYDDSFIPSLRKLATAARQGGVERTDGLALSLVGGQQGGGRARQTAGGSLHWQTR